MIFTGVIALLTAPVIGWLILCAAAGVVAGANSARRPR